MDSLSFYDVESGALITTLDLGAINRCTSDDTQLRVYNNSTSYQSEQVTVSATGTDEGQLWVSNDGDRFYASVLLGDIPPQSYSPPFTLRRVTPLSAPEQAFTASISALPVGWTSPVDTTTSGVTPLDTSDS